METITFGFSIHATPTGVRRHDYPDAPVSIEFGGMCRDITIFCPDAIAADLTTAIREVLAKHAGSETVEPLAAYAPEPNDIPF